MDRTPKGIARLDFIAHKARHKYRDRRPGVDVFWLERMRNDWVAYHAGADWMHGCPACPYGDVVQADNMRLRAEVERLHGVCREAAQRLRSLSGQPNHGPKSLLDHVADLERDALTREDGEG